MAIKLLGEAYPSVSAICSTVSPSASFANAYDNRACWRCGACRLKLVKGEVTYRQQPLAFINAGEILPCCCMPLTDIELEM